MSTATALVLAAGLFAFVTWQYYREISTASERRIERQLATAADVALVRLQAVESVMAQIDETLRGRADDGLPAAPDARGKLERLAAILPQAKSVRVTDGAGHPLFDGAIAVAPSNDGAARPRPAEAGAALDIRAAADGSLAVSRRRSAPGGEAAGTIEVALGPDFFKPFRDMASAAGGFAALMRADGAVIAGYGVSDSELRALWLKAVPSQANIPDRILFKARLDRDDVFAGFSRVGTFPVYLLTGIDRASLRETWAPPVGMRVALGLQALAVLLLVALGFSRRRRSQPAPAAEPEPRPQAVGRCSSAEAE